MAQNCPHCGSRYVEKKGVEEDFSSKTQNYRCLSCGKYFSVTDEKRSAQGTWLMTFHDGSGYKNQKIEVYRDSYGRISINQQYGGKCISGSVRIELYASENTYMPGKYYVYISTIQSNNDPNGVLFSVDSITMNPEMTQQALQTEAMRIIYNQYSKKFHLDKYHTKEINYDVAEYLRNAIGARDQGVVSKALDGCYIATAVYGSYDCPQVWTLRRFRDSVLAETWYGRAFIRTYYAISPTLVKWFGHTGWFRKLWRGRLDRLVEALRKRGFESTPYQDRNW